MTRLVLAAALVVAASFAAAPASATDCSQNPKNCGGACHFNPEFTGPNNIIVCYS
jgi:Spy/CpxP family protein refolding chaperone